MASIIIAAAVGGFVLLLAATIALVVLNWGEKTRAPVYSILVVGTATMLAAVMVSLKESTVESVFSTSIVLDTAEGAPPLILPDPNNLKLSSRLSEFARIGRPAINRDGKTIITIQKPSNEGERFTFCGELLQYRLFQIIEKLQRGGWIAGQQFGASFSSVTKPLKLSNAEDYPAAGRTILEIVSANRFSNSDMEQFFWRNRRVRLPKGTKVDFIHVASSPATGTEKYIIRLQKPLFFSIEFEVAPLLGTGIGVPPKGLLLAPELVARWETYQFQVTMRAVFEKITAGNWQTQEYKDWANSLFTGVRDDLAD
jgi:hypothetical protein